MMDQTTRRNTGVMQDNVQEASAGRVSAYKMVWLFMIGCVIGFLLESVVCLVNKGYIESRRGVIYGPFNQVYGFGAVAMVMALSPLAGRTKLTIFAASALVGGGFEFLCSWLQEKVLGTISWDYSHEVMSIGGRTSLKFMIFWGALGILLICYLYPVVSRWIDRIPRRTGVAMARLLAAFMVVNMAVSFAAVHRWHARVGGAAATSQVEEALDELYPDDRMETIYPNMKAMR